MTSAGASSDLPASGPARRSVKNRAATAALIVAIVGFVVTKFPTLGALAGSPEDIAAVVLGIIGSVAAFRNGTGKGKAIAALVVAVATIAGIPFGEGTLW